MTLTRKSLRSLAIVAALVSAGTGIAASPASAAGAVGQLTLTFTNATTGAVMSQVTLTCEPTGGTHPYAQAACDDLIPVYGRIASIPPEYGVACPDYYMPVYATAIGSWEGIADTYRAEFYNTCAANVETGGHVFKF